MVEKYYSDDGQYVAVLVSPGLGAGWSTWALDNQEEFMLFDAELVRMALAGDSRKVVDAYLDSRFGNDAPYGGGWRDIEVSWLPVGQHFRVDEYDGNETLVLPEDERWHEA